ncbi:MAG: hypothetical protein AAF957_04970 [Planctomycetota bacterium]
MMRRNSLLIAATAGLATACGGGGSDPAPAPPGPTSSLSTIDTSLSRDGIVPLPATVDRRISAVFDRYTELTAPNGMRIHFLSQGNVPDALLFRTRGIVRQHIFDVTGASLGADKAAVFDVMATNQSTLILYENDTTFDPNDPDVQDFLALFNGIYMSVDASTIVQEGSPEYLQPQPEIDASFDATVQFVHLFGISKAAPDFDAQLGSVTSQAVTNGIFRPDPGVPNSRIDDAYLGLALSVYYGNWAHDPRGDGTAGPAGEYDFADRASMAAGDPQMIAVIESFFSPSQRFPAYLDESFNDTFEMAFDPLLTYTHRAQYLERVGVRGASTARINGNDLDNTFLGNDFANQFEGGRGNDSIEGDGGADVAYFTGNRADYTIVALDATVTRVIDSVADRDGYDDVRGIVQLRFADENVDL